MTYHIKSVVNTFHLIYNSLFPRLQYYRHMEYKPKKSSDFAFKLNFHKLGSTIFRYAITLVDNNTFVC